MRERIEALHPWFQHFVFSDGTEVGTWPTEQKCEMLTEGIELQGKRALDIACMSGAASLWLERQGCEVVGCDIEERTAAQFALVKEAFGMKAEYEQCSVYSIGCFSHYDVVLMMGLYYHLQDPLRGLNQAWNACREVLLLEGEVSPFGWEAPSQASFHRDAFKGDITNWWVPTVRCLEDWCLYLDGAKKVEIIYPFLSECRAGARVFR